MRKRTPFTFKIDRGVPVPILANHAIYKLDRMKPGDSFRFPAANQNSVSGIVSKWRLKFKNQKFIIRRLDAKSCRCWRTK